MKERKKMAKEAGNLLPRSRLDLRERESKTQEPGCPA